MTDQLSEQRLREMVAQELFDIWKDAKSSEVDNWDDVTFESLPEEHKHEYYLTADRIANYYKEKYKGYVKLAEDQTFPKELLADFHNLSDVLKAGWRKVEL